MIFITLVKFRRKPTNQDVAETAQRIRQAGGKLLSNYWTLGRYDAVVTVEAADERTAMKGLLQWQDLIATETLVGVPFEEAAKML